MATRPLIALFVPVLVVGLLSACDEEQQAEAPEIVRAIKTVTVKTIATSQIREISGVVEAAQKSALSFEVTGQVKTVNVKKGDKVEKGQVLATLDRTSYALNVRTAEADVRKSKAVLHDKSEKFKQQAQLYKKGWTTKSKYDQAQADLESAKSTLTANQARLNLAKRDLSKTVLAAPFDGVVAKRDVDPFVEIKTGQAVFELDNERDLKVAVLMPESLIRLVKVGQEVRVRFPTLENSVTGGRVSEVGSRATEANSFPVDVALVDSDSVIRAGMTAAVEFEFQSGIEAITRNKDAVGKQAFLVPITAIAPGEGSGVGHVFIFDPATSTVKKTAIRGRGVKGNDVEIFEGVKEGDVLAVAGVSFLTDGQKVTLYKPKK